MTFHLNGTVGDFNYLPVFSYTWVSTLDPKVFPGLPHTAQLYLFKYSRTIPFGSGDADVGWLITDTDPRDMARGGLGSAMLIAGVKEEDSLQCPQDAGQQWYGYYSTPLFTSSAIVPIAKPDWRLGCAGCPRFGRYWLENHLAMLASLAGLLLLLIVGGLLLCCCVCCECCPMAKCLKRRRETRAAACLESGQAGLLAHQSVNSAAPPAVAPQQPS